MGCSLGSTARVVPVSNGVACTNTLQEATASKTNVPDTPGSSRIATEISLNYTPGSNTLAFDTTEITHEKSSSHAPSLETKPSDTSKVANEHQTSLNQAPSDGRTTDPSVYNLIEDDSEPKVRPPNKRKKDLVPDISVFKVIDKHAAEVPKSAKTSVQTLSKYLSKAAKNDLETVRAFYKWIQLNISYDIESFFSGNHVSGRPDDVLNTGLSVCAGYANLFEELCTHAGVRCKNISGYAKGYGYNPEIPFSLTQKTDHAWNAVFLFGEWYFVECTWGTGYWNGSQYVMENNEFWFLTDPDHFINAHFPYMDNDIRSSEQWQLLEKPISLDIYSKIVRLQSLAFDYNIELSHTDAVLHVQEQVQITMRSPSFKLETFNASLEQGGQNCNKYVMAELIDLNKYVVTVKPPSKSTFKLSLNANHEKTINNMAHSLVTFTIKCNKVDKYIKPYPELYGVWGAAVDVTEYGFEESACSKVRYIVDAGEKDIHLPFLKGVNSKVILKLEHAEKVINGINNYTMASATADSLVAKVRLPTRGFYKLTVFSGRLNSQSNMLEPIMNLLLECTQPAHPCYPLPEVYPSVLEYQVELIAPVMRDLQANTETTFKLRSSKLQRVLCNQKVIEKPTSDKWVFSITTPQSGENMCIFGTSTLVGSFDGLFEFKII